VTIEFFSLLLVGSVLWKLQMILNSTGQHFPLDYRVIRLDFYKLLNYTLCKTELYNKIILSA